MAKVDRCGGEVVRFVYMGGLSSHLSGWNLIPRYSFVVGSRMPKALEKFDIKEIYADASAKRVLDNAKIGEGKRKVDIQSFIADELSVVRTASVLSEKRYEDESRQILMSVLTKAFSPHGIKIIVAKDKPYIYFIKDKDNLELYNRTGVQETNPHERIKDTRHINPTSLVRLLNDTLPPKRKAEVDEHLAGCADCSEAYQRLEQKAADKGFKKEVI
jgi:hypothetical protein